MSETPPSPAPSRREKFARKTAIDLSVMTVIGLALALIGPFGSFASPLPVRLVSWLTFSYLGYAIFNPMGFVVERMHRSLDLPKAWLWVAACIIASVPMAVLVWVANNAWNSGPMRAPPLNVALIHYAYVLVIGGGITLLFNTLSLTRDAHRDVMGDVMGDTVGGAGGDAPAGSHSQPPQLKQAAAPTPPPQTTTPFLGRLPPELGSDLLALEMEDHYVRAHTALGSDLILLRLRDAVAELNGLEGAQVHRSWWVARHAVEDVRREGRNIRLLLPGGLEAPVSRAMAPQLKQEGWW